MFEQIETALLSGDEDLRVCIVYKMTQLLQDHAKLDEQPLTLAGVESILLYPHSTAEQVILPELKQLDPDNSITDALQTVTELREELICKLNDLLIKARQ